MKISTVPSCPPQCALQLVSFSRIRFVSKYFLHLSNWVFLVDSKSPTQSVVLMIRFSRVLRAEAVTNRLLLTLSSPSECIYNKAAVDSVTVPGMDGAFTLTNGHSANISQLGPGVVTVRNGSESRNFFMTNGYAYLKHAKDSSGCSTAEVLGAEIVPVEALDKDRIQSTLSDLASAPKDTEWDKIKTTLGQAMLASAIRAAS
eukprot:GDKH01008613.1.p2 GENE.GDKH01008613.1~~GDKH01008613.1.p2  ORF type:complete len:202 (-),score=17.04 GDKH01008613.1:124-729(-)